MPSAPSPGTVLGLSTDFPQLPNLFLYGIDLRAQLAGFVTGCNVELERDFARSENARTLICIVPQCNDFVDYLGRGISLLQALDNFFGIPASKRIGQSMAKADRYSVQPCGDEILDFNHSKEEECE